MADGLTEPRYKRPFDLAILVLSHVILLPILVIALVVISLLIWLEDRRPFLFRQQRVGKDGRVFTIYKFRTMAFDEKRPGLSWNVEGDPRLTRVGKLLRKAALDEIPQLWSIWKGDMSLVGPRALVEEEQRILEERFSGFEQRLQVRPGLTGLAQIHNRSDEPEAKLRYDLEYIELMNIFLDVRLLVRSVMNSITGRWDRREGKKFQKPPSSS